MVAAELDAGGSSSSRTVMSVVASGQCMQALQATEVGGAHDMHSSTLCAHTSS